MTKYLPATRALIAILLSFVLSDRSSLVVLDAAPSAEVKPSSTITSKIEEILLTSKYSLALSAFLYETPDFQWLPSDVFTVDGFIDGLRVMYEDGVANKYFYLGTEGSTRDAHLYGVANIAAFLAQVMKESLQYNACDENNWDLFNGRYPISNSCGQLGQSYQDYTCPEGEEDIQCDVDPDMVILGTTNAKWYGAPAPFKCAPKTLYPTTGYWDYFYECNNPWANPPRVCTDYVGQKAGKEIKDTPVQNRNGRTDIEGCCWWGRGAIQTSGICNYGRLNYYLGKRAADEGRPSRYPDVDLCKTPDAICSNEKYPELKWVAGMFFWMDKVQTYNKDGWDYLTELHTFVDGGMEGEAFINSVSGIVNRGCHDPPCGTGDLDGGPDRLANFVKVLTILTAEAGSPVLSPVTTSPVVVDTSATPVVGTSTPPVVATTTTPVMSPVITPPTTGVNVIPSVDDLCCAPGETSTKAAPGCGSFYQCLNGAVYPGSLQACPTGLVFDIAIGSCNWETICNVVPCPTVPGGLLPLPPPPGVAPPPTTVPGASTAAIQGSSAPDLLPMLWKLFFLIFLIITAVLS